MPNVAGKKFAYTPEGIKASKRYKKKPEKMGDIVDRPPYKKKK